MRLIILKILALAGFFISAIQSHQFYQIRNGSAAFRSFCNINASMNCDVVTASSYAELFFGLPVSSFAAGWYLALFFVVWMARNPFWRREALRASLCLTATACVLSIFYLGVMAFVIKSYCLFCLFIDAINFTSLGIAASLGIEGTKTHPLDKAKWKVFIGTGAAAVLVAVLGLNAFENPVGIKTSSVTESAENILRIPQVPVNMAISPLSVGPLGAKVTIVEFSDFQCPHCKHGATLLNSLLNRYPGKLRVILRNYPLDSSCNRKVEHAFHLASCEAAKAVICGAEQGKFEAVYETMFEKQELLAPGKPTAFAKEAGADEQKLLACMSSPETAAILAKDIEEGIQLGVQSTPTFFINGHKVEGVYPASVWIRVIEGLL